MKTDLELLKEYLQCEIDCGNHKLFIFDENNYVTELKTIDGFNAITDLEQDIANYVKITIHHRKEIERLNNIINETIEYLKYQLENFDFYEDTKAKLLCSMVIVMLKGSDEE